MRPAVSRATRVAAVIGSPVGHSLSPALHEAAFAAADLDWRFLAFDVPAGEAGQALDAMRALRLDGFAVTMPHKAAVAALVDEVDPAAANLRSVNTVVRRDDGSTFGASTDGDGFVAWLTACNVEVGGVRSVVLGAGAAGRSIVDALGRAGAADIAIVNRSPDRAEAAAELAPVARVGTLDDVDRAVLVVNTTSVGMGTDEIPITAGRLRPDLTVADIVYHPLDTALLRAARAVGAPTVDGLGMLVHQAVLQQLLWTGVRPDPGVMRSAAEAELAARAEAADR